MNVKFLIGSCLLVVFGAAGGITLMSWSQKRSADHRQNVDLAFDSAKARLKTEQPLPDPFAKDDQRFVKLESLCESFALDAIARTGEVGGGQPFQTFELLGYFPAFDGNRTFVFNVVGSSGRHGLFGCMADDSYALQRAGYLYSQ